MNSPLPATLARIKTTVLRRIDAFTVAKGHAQSWAHMTGSVKFVVVAANGVYLLADFQDLRCYHRRDIAQKRTRVVFVAQP